MKSKLFITISIMVLLASCKTSKSSCDAYGNNLSRTNKNITR